MEVKLTTTNIDVFCSTVFTSCTEIYKSEKRRSGAYNINPDGVGIIDVFCDQTTAGGGWLVFQKRLDGSVDFYRGWAEYKLGFGNRIGEFWLGLNKLHRLTSSGNYKLRVDLKNFAGNTYYAEYDVFEVASEGEKYKLSVGNYSGLTFCLRSLIAFLSVRTFCVLWKTCFLVINH